MSYTALYRKLRPQQFKDIIGQDHVVTTLKNQIESDRISHAYLFCGTRGTGKTSTAKVFAKAVNCQNKADGSAEPCNVCESCVSINQQRSMSVLELDAASNNGVDNIRDIRTEVNYPPANGDKYKIYIIDEVHMLSIGAFNALLKTLEEPPSHVIFILATTDPQKVPVTILSRCQRFDLKRISTNTMFNTLKTYISNENFTITDEALMYICQNSDGAMRDALSILDQCVSFFYNEEITIDKVLELLGSVNNDVLFEISDAIFTYDGTRCINIIEQIFINGRDIKQFISEELSHVRNVLVAKNISEPCEALNFSEDYIAKLKLQGENINEFLLIDLIKELSLLLNDIKYSSNPRIDLETFCLKMCYPSKPTDVTSLLKRIEKLENELTSKTVNLGLSTAPPNQPVLAEPTAPPEEKKILNKAIPEDFQKAISGYTEIIKTIKSAPTTSMMLKTKPGFLENDILYIVCGTPTELGIIKNNFNLVKESFEKALKVEMDIRLISKYEYNQLHGTKYGIKDESIDEFKEIYEKIPSLIFNEI